MLKQFGYFYFHTGLHLAQAKETVERWQKDNPGLNYIPDDDFAATWPLQALSNAKIFALELSLPTFVAEIDRAYVQYKNAAKAVLLAHDLEKVGERFGDELELHHFKLVTPDLCAFYDKERLFGDLPYEKIPAARADIREAGTCYALERPTACVFHLMRAMEVVVRRLARRFSLPTGLDVTWVVLTGNMSEGSFR